MTYGEAVVKEVLRVAPPSDSVQRRTLVDMEVGALARYHITQQVSDGRDPGRKIRMLCSLFIGNSKLCGGVYVLPSETSEIVGATLHCRIHSPMCGAERPAC